ncbi:MAG: hypothetical protein FWD49_00745 [Firmicutes bacterium]|nr:hypothetical protein [Bacillota bacterium]
MKKPISKNAIIAIVLIFVLAVAFGVGLYLILDFNKEFKELYESEKIRIISKDFVKDFSFDELKELATPKTFTATYKPNQRLPITREYTGFCLLDIFSALDIELSKSKGVSFMPSDGRETVYNINDILTPNNVFIAFKWDGKAFPKGNAGISPYPDENGGPFVVIRAKDLVSTNRVKWLVQIEVLF